MQACPGQSSLKVYRHKRNLESNSGLHVVLNCKNKESIANFVSPLLTNIAK